MTLGVLQLRTTKNSVLGKSQLEMMIWPHTWMVLLIYHEVR